MTDDPDLRSLVVESTTKVLRDRCDPQTINSAGDESWKAPLWRELADAGLALSWVPEKMGGAGVPVEIGFDVLYVAGQFAIPVPLAETMVSGWLLSRAGINTPQGPITLASSVEQQTIAIESNGALSGTARAVPFAGEADHLVVLAEADEGAVIALVEMQDCRITETGSISGDSRGDISVDGVVPVAAAPLPGALQNDTVMLIGAAVRARQIAGALQAILDLAVAYAKERVAFGRPIGKFQAVQHNLARLAGEVAAANAVSGSAADAIAHAEGFDDAVFLEITSAKIRAGEAAGAGAAIAHQVFGAIGFTQEHILHRFTRRLWAWRDDFGSESLWAERLGRRVVTAGADELWPMLAAR